MAGSDHTYIHTPMYAYVKLWFIGFINVLVSTEYKTCQKHTIYHKKITTKTQRQQGKIQLKYTAFISSDIHIIVLRLTWGVQ